jgi:hypothetical protein
MSKRHERPLQDPSPKLAWRQGFLFLLLVLGLYWLYGWRPFLVHAGLVVDDFLYIRHAKGFLDWLHGRSPTWLGPFDCFCLGKTPLYGLWLALLNLLRIPLRVGDFLLLLASPFLLRRAVKSVAKLEGWKFAVVVVLLVANPFFPCDYRIRREGLQIALTNLCLIGTVGLVLRGEAPFWERFRWAAMTGLLVALCYLNREEAIWIVVAMVVAGSLLLVQALLRRRQGPQSLLSSLKSRAMVLVVFGLGFLLPVLTVCALNQRHYGVFLTTFRRSSAVIGLHHRLTSLEPSGHEAYVPINRATRMRAYALSPTFARLQPFLEAEAGFWAAGNGPHSISNGRSPADREIFASTFEFCLLHAAEEAGARTAGEIEAMFVAIDRELGEAVRAGKIQAGGHGPSLLVAPRAGDSRRILAAWGDSFWSLIRVAHAPLYWPTSFNASQAQLDDLARLTSSSVALYPMTGGDFSARAYVFDWIKSIQRIFYPVLFLSWFGLLMSRRKEVFTRAPSPQGLLLWSMAIPLGGLASFCLGMAVVEVLFFRLLASAGYNLLGFAPLTVLCAFVFVGLTMPVARSCRDDLGLETISQ